MIGPLSRRFAMAIAGAAVGATAMIAVGAPAFAKKNGSEVREESGSSGRGSGTDDRQVRDDNSGRGGGSDDSSSGQGSGNSGRGSGNSGSTRHGGLDEVSSKVDASAGVPPDSQSASRVQRVRFRDDDRL